jgi:hypothetical protein
MHQYPHFGVTHRTPRAVTGALVIAALLSGCASPTKVSSVWHDKNQRATRFDRLLVVAVSDNADRRLSFEDALVNQLRGPKTEAWASARLMPADAPVNEESLRGIVAQQQADAVIVTKLESVEVKPVESGGRSDVLARQNETGIGMTPERKSGTVFQYDYEEKIEPVYITAEYSAVLTTDVYNVTDGTNIYSVITTTTGQNTVAEIIAELSKAIAERLRSDGVIH